MQKMNPRYKSLWVEALRSGKYKQCTGEYMVPENTSTCRYCVLGVLAKVVAKDKHGRFCDYAVRDKLCKVTNVSDEVFYKLVHYNDHGGRTLKWLAGYIERYL